MGYEKLNIDIDMGSKYLINESAYFLGGIFAANESVISKGQKYWISPVRYNHGKITTSELEVHFQHVKAMANKLSNNTLMVSTIRRNGLDSGKFKRLLGFGTFFKTNEDTDLEDMIPEVKKALLNSSNEVKRCFIAGMFDGRGSIDINRKKGNIRYFVLDCENETVGRFLCEIVEDYGLSYNYNQARERLEGGTPRKDQLRIPGSENFIMKIGLISDKKFSIVASIYDSNTYKTKIENDVLDGLKLIERR